MILKPFCAIIIQENKIGSLQGRVRFPTGGIAHEPFAGDGGRAGFGEIPRPTVTVWMEEDDDTAQV